MKKIVSSLVGLGMIAGTVVMATPASAVTCEQLAPYSVKELKKKYKKKKRQCNRLEKEAQERLNAQKKAIPPTVSNLVVVAPSTEEQDYRYDYETSKYAISFQIPEAAKGNGINEFVLTLGDKTETMYVFGGDCENGVCTYTKDYLEAPWGSTAVVGVTSVSFYGQMSEMVVASAVMPARPKTTVTYTWRAYGNYSAEVPTDSGGTSDVVGYNEFSKTFNRGSSPSYKYRASAFSFDGEAWCEVLRDGVRIEYESSNGGAVGAYCW